MARSMGTYCEACGAEQGKRHHDRSTGDRSIQQTIYSEFDQRFLCGPCRRGADEIRLDKPDFKVLPPRVPPNAKDAACPPERSLAAFYSAWISDQGLPMGSTEEVSATHGLTREQRLWLVAFETLWDQTEKMQHANLCWGAAPK